MPNDNCKNVCPAVGYKEVAVCVPVVLDPFADLCDVTVKCLDGVTMLEECQDTSCHCCKLTLCQKMCIEIPVNFGVNVTSDPAYIGDGCVCCCDENCNNCTDKPCDCNCPESSSSNCQKDEICPKPDCGFYKGTSECDDNAKGFKNFKEETANNANCSQKPRNNGYGSKR